MVLLPEKAQGQTCGSGTPSFPVDLTGNPDSVWTSPFVQRNDTCCGATHPDGCVKFDVTLDPAAYAIELDIVDGAEPTGSLFYQVGCGSPVPVGERLCLSGTGPHTVTFCKPGNNDNVYQITSIKPPSVSGDIVISEACQGTISATGFADTSITWQSVPNDSFHNSFLSCREDCDTTHVQAKPGYPNYVDYEVCGVPQGACGNITECDTVRVTFVSDLEVDILPDSPFVCYGESTETLDAQITGGKAPYQYNWNTGETTSKIDVGSGNYSVSVTDSTTCPAAEDSVFVDSFTLPIQANTGPDTLLCGHFTGVPLSGSVQAASGGKWEGGNGTFNPSDSVLNPVYHPTNAEIQNDSLDLQLITIGNKSCDPDTNEMTMYFAPKPSPAINGNDQVCEFSSGHTYSTTNNTGSSYSWSVTGGQITSNSGNSIQVDWKSNGTGEVAVTETNATGCDTTVTMNIQIDPRPEPVITGDDTVCEYTSGHTYSTPSNAGSSYSWTVINGTITSGSGTASVTVDWESVDSGHLTVTETNDLGCDTIVEKAVHIKPRPIPAISGADTVCEYISGHTYSTPSNAGSSYSWTVTNGTIASGSGTASVTVDWESVDSGHLTVTETNDLGCDTIVEKAVHIKPRPTPVISGADTVCEHTAGHTYSTSANAGSSYNWTVTNGTITSGSGTASVTVDWEGVDSGHLTVTETNDLGCDTIVEKAVHIKPRPIPAISGADTVCEYTSGHTYSTPSNAGSSYSWTVTNGTIASGSGTASVTVDWEGVDSGHLTVTETNDLGCDTTVEKAIHIKPRPTPAISGADTVCEYTSGHTYSTSNNPGSNYNWTVTNGTITSGSGTASVTVDWEDADSGQLSVTEINDLNCDTTVNKPVHIKPRPTPAISGTDTVCEYTSGHNYSTPNNPGSNYSWTVTNGTITSGSGTASIQIKWNGPDSGRIALTETIPSGCDTTVQTKVYFNPRPDATFTGPDSVCNRTSGTFTAIVDSSDYTYDWQTTIGNIQNGQGTPGISAYWNDTGEAVFKLQVMNDHGCQDTHEASVPVHPIPEPAIDGPTSVCAYSTHRYTIDHNNLRDINWQVQGGTILSGQDTKAVNVQWEDPGNHALSIWVLNEHGCDTTVETGVEVNEAPQPDITGPENLCAYSQQVRYEVSYNPGNQHEWEVAGGELVSQEDTNIVYIDWGASGQGSLTVEELNPETGCAEQAALDVNLEPAPTPSIEGPATICLNDGSGTYQVASNNDHNYFWDVSGGTITSGSGTHQIEVEWDDVDTGKIETYVQNEVTGCDSTTSTEVEMFEAVAETPQDTSGCEDFMLKFEGNANDDRNQFYWDFDNGAQSRQQHPTVIYRKPGFYHVQLRTVTPQGCEDISYTSVRVYETPEAQFEIKNSGDRNLIKVEEDSLLRLNNLTSNAQYFAWDFGDGTESLKKEPVHYYDSAREYSVKMVAENRHGCKDSTSESVRVRVPSEVWVPNAMTPDGNGINDHFSVGTYNITEFEIFIFNRWGEIIFRSKDKDFAWDGHYKGEIVQDDVYHYLIQAQDENGEFIKKYGKITLVK